MGKGFVKTGILIHKVRLFFNEVKIKFGFKNYIIASSGYS